LEKKRCAGAADEICSLCDHPFPHRSIKDGVVYVTDQIAKLLQIIRAIRRDGHRLPMPT